MKTGLPLLVAALAAACGSAPPGGSPAGCWRSEPAVREAAFRHLFAHNASGLQDEAGAYYLRWQDAEPDAAFLARFGDHRPPVLPASRCDAGEEKGVIDRVTGERGLLFTIESIEWVSDDQAVVMARYYEAGLSAGGYRLVVERDGEGFIVVDDSMLWIS